ncbi:hypothetical protein TrST_g1106 [Triparma strigata]|uniref:Uncharacterized protein n=1 Tax=Triparma strigata TaxID=1606541 RepID=A0A9W7AC08_9STRA|nr:hypothetical protein TrST_g1106 [Triparma strigata]
MSCAVIGGGPTGFSTLPLLTKRSLRVTLIESSSSLGSGTPFSGSPALGARAMSFDSSHLPTSRLLHSLSSEVDGFSALDDGLLSAGLLSRTVERPQGWNRATGQWEHYTCDSRSIGTVLRGMGGLYFGDDDGDGDGTMDDEGSRSPELLMGTKLVGMERVGDCWRLALLKEEGEEAGPFFRTFDSVILCVPAPSLTSLLDPISTLLLPHTLEVIKRCASKYVTRHSGLVSIPSSSPIHDALISKLKAPYCSSQGTHSGRNEDGVDGVVHELDLTNVSKSIKLISVVAANEQGLTIVLHSAPDVVLDRDVISSFFDSFLKPQHPTSPSNFTLQSSSTFTQYPANPSHPITPLSPLREHGCIPLSISPPLIAAGDWTRGTGVTQAAIESGGRAAETAIKIIDGEEIKL